jgi:hypothetical protein
MTDFQPIAQTSSPIARRPCARCGWDMSVTSMLPDRRDHGTRTFQCSMCEHFEGAFGKAN